MTGPETETDATLLFEWAPPTSEKFLISSFIVGSLLLHAVAFYVFRIIYPPTVAVLPPPARVNLISASSEEGRTLLRWIEAEDPALASATVRPAETRSRTLPKLEHVPSYMVHEPKLKDAPPFSLLPAVPPSAFPPGPVQVSGNEVETPWPKLATQVTFSEELKDLGELKLAAPQFTGSTTQPPEAVRFRIAVNNGGAIAYCFRLNSSGDSSLDEQARLWLLKVRFTTKSPAAEQNETTLVWGVATIEWGNDITQPNRASTPTSP